jgi:para-aminobenzoate synthetase
MPGTQRILYIDAYDSFSYNIVGLLESCLGVPVTVVKIDDQDVAWGLEELVSSYTAVVVGPGPGNPENESDVGFVNRLWELSNDQLLPVLGICLGFQCLAKAFGARIERLREPRHGLVNTITHRGEDIFAGLPSFKATQYHSLRANIETPAGEYSWSPTPACPSLIPLAWDLSDSINGPVLSGLRHTLKPFWGVQYHPESICTDEVGANVVQNWWNYALLWNNRHERVQAYVHVSPFSRMNGRRLQSRSDEVIHDVCKLAVFGANEWQFQYNHIQNTRLDILDTAEALSAFDNEVVLLDSQGTKGRFDILGLIDSETVTLTHTVHDRRLALNRSGTTFASHILDDESQIWVVLQKQLKRNISGAQWAQGNPPTPFSGGLMGFVSYEAGLDTLSIDSRVCHGHISVPDMNFALVERSVVFDHQDGRIYVQSLRTSDNQWLLETSAMIGGLVGDRAFPSPPPEREEGLSSSEMYTTDIRDTLKYFRSGFIQRPSRTCYENKVLECQKSLNAGDSYELCLTAPTVIAIPKNEQLSIPWSLYKDLRARNPAPFGTFIKLNGCTIVGSSPERFLSWDRSGKCQMRPIKGTVKKVPGMTFDKASAILNTSKERAENLMIVDLVRHDLSGVIGAENVQVTKLMQVEEYETVYQLVTVIEGQIPKSRDCEQTGERNSTQATGIDILQAALPPGSMTGAPKKRSCELLQELEEFKPRGIYSGVIGYMDVFGGGDFSVVIRTAFRQDNEVVVQPVDGIGKSVPHEIWRIGAGGAVTVQSTASGEFEEMEAKLESVIGIFRND